MAVAMGMWQSRLLFGLALVGSQWLPEKYLPRQWNHLATTKGEMLLLQRLQNKMMRVLLGTRDWLTPTSKLLEECSMLSVTQLTVAATAAVGVKATNTGRPAWLASQMVKGRDTRTAKGNIAIPMTRTNIRQESLVMKASKSLNMLPPELKNMDVPKGWKAVKRWCGQAIPLKPP